MKKAQVMLEYIIFLLIATLLCCAFSQLLWNRKAVIRNGSFGVEVETNHGTQVHVAPMME